MEEEHWHAMSGVAGSTPAVRSNSSWVISSDGRRASRFEREGRGFKSCMALNHLASEAQNRAERQSSKLEEAGSTPVTRSTLINLRARSQGGKGAGLQTRSCVGSNPTARSLYFKGERHNSLSAINPDKKGGDAGVGHQ
jgi:hypothetical protein